jgi:cyclase
VKNVRIIPRLDIKGPNLIKGIHLEGLRVVGDPHAYALHYYEEGADELVFMDVVASLYGRNNISGIIERAADRVFIPITVGGGIRSVEDARNILRSGADKVAINTAAVQRPGVISEISREFGSQATVLSIEAKQVGPSRWEAYTDNGRERTGLDVIEWTKRAVELGVGEVLLTSVDKEGTRKGYDIELVRQVSECASVPVIASGGLGTLGHLTAALSLPFCAAVAMADVLHYNRLSLMDIKNSVREAGMAARIA